MTFASTIFQRWMPLAVLVALAPIHAQTGSPGELVLSPADPAPGANLEVAYDPGSVLPLDGALDLRARLRTPDLAWPDRLVRTQSVARLERGSDGVYRGHFTLPDSVVFALFAVATPSGDAVDSNLEAGWPLMVHGTDGRPTVAAYSEYLEDLGNRDFRAGLRVARAFTQDHPRRARAWSQLSFYQGVLPTEAPDSAAAATRVAALDRALSDAASPDLEDALAMTWLAEPMGETSTRWVDWLIENAPTFPGSVRHRTYRVLMEQHGAPPRDRLAALDAIYLEAGAVDEVLMDVGSRTADEAGDPEAALQWADRRAAAVPAHSVRTARALARSPLTRAEGVRRLEAEIAALEDGPTEDRPLFMTVAEERAAHSRAMIRLRSDLGEAMTALGDPGARVPLEAAWAGLWDAAPLAALANAREASGDIEGAAEALSRIVADPSAEDRDAIGRRGQDLVGIEAWSRMKMASLAASRRWTLAQSPPIVLDRALEVAGPDGDRFEVGTAMAPAGSTVIVTFARGCGYCVQAAPQIEALHERLSRTSDAVVVLSSDDPVENDFFDERNMTVPVVYDVERSVMLALGSAATPNYFVVDRTGAARYIRSIEDVARHLDALAAE